MSNVVFNFRNQLYVGYTSWHRTVQTCNNELYSICTCSYNFVFAYLLQQFKEIQTHDQVTRFPFVRMYRIYKSP